MGFKEYEDPRELEKVQMLSAYVLKELDRVCTELDIPYVLWAGTALGAVRHQGFIPWDAVSYTHLTLPTTPYV